MDYHKNTSKEKNNFLEFLKSSNEEDQEWMQKTLLKENVGKPTLGWIGKA